MSPGHHGARFEVPGARPAARGPAGPEGPNLHTYTFIVYIHILHNIHIQMYIYIYVYIFIYLHRYLLIYIYVYYIMKVIVSGEGTVVHLTTVLSDRM